MWWRLIVEPITTALLYHVNDTCREQAFRPTNRFSQAQVLEPTRFPSASTLDPGLSHRPLLVVNKFPSGYSQSTLSGKFCAAETPHVGLRLKHTLPRESPFSSPCRKPRWYPPSATGETKNLIVLPETCPKQ